MGIIIILLELVVLPLSGFFFGRILAVNPEQRELEDKEQIDWLRKYQETKYTR
ncbi:hypothetical protein [Lacrimispora sphenoides]|uniref:Uncharacterized protein n=1 Tax=Lacrimispora sphenoides JCM 1415 TaxID=1297793 RepID=A0ABY1CHY7_9FIRM|nr:hypothetical protein [Lacrimispora sphenoides]SEU05875.1 hypothetical protein SAMN02745906_4487 [[Clostridium] sphenoides JCM 1415]SUY49054.1 Uncharacterised protein [Lacrimispora sphenoides]